MTFMKTLIMAGAAVLTMGTFAAQAGDTMHHQHRGHVRDDATPTGHRMYMTDDMPHGHVKAGKDGSYKVITYEGNKKVTTVYKPIGVRKVGMVGHDPYPVHSGRGMHQGGEYYTEDGVKYFKNTQSLRVRHMGVFND